MTATSLSTSSRTVCPCSGIDPAERRSGGDRARVSASTRGEFGLEFARRLVADGKRPRLVLGNNVLAQVPDINDFVAGVAVLLAEGGTATFEFPHLGTLVEHLEYDTIYHEHFSYFSLRHPRDLRCPGSCGGRRRGDPEHGGSLRVFFAHADEAPDVSPAVAALIEREDAAGLRDPGTYRLFTAGVEMSKRASPHVLLDARSEGKQVVGYGAPGKGNTLL